jgi:hypothetical protein
VNGVWVLPVEPQPSLRAVRHQVNNMLAPVTVAAELLDDGSDTAQLLRRSAERLRRASEQVGRFLRLSAPTLSRVDVARVAAATGAASPTQLPSGPDLTVEVDLERLSAMVGELVQLLDASGVLAGLQNVVYPDGRSEESLVLTLPVTTTVQSAEMIALLGVPLACEGVDPGVAVACRELHLQGARVRVAPRHWEICIPVTRSTDQGTSR